MATNGEKFTAMLKDVSGGNNGIRVYLEQVAEESGIQNLDEMTDAEYEETVRNFAAGPLRESIAKALSNTDPNGEQKTWKDLSGVAQRANSYAKNSFGRDFDTLKKYYGEKVPLLQLSEDDAEMKYQAAIQGTSPEVLKKEISDAWEVKKGENAKSAKNERIKKAVEDREKLWKDYEEGKFDEEFPGGRPFGWVLRNAAKNPFGRRVMEQTEQNVKTGEGSDNILDPSLAAPAALDLVQGVGETYGGAKIAGLAAGKIGGIAGQAATDAGFNVVGQAADIYRGTQSSFDPIQTLYTAAASATIPDAMTRLAGFAGKTPSMRGTSRQMTKTLHGVDTPAETEKKQFKELTDKAKESRELARMNKKDVAMQDRAIYDEEAAGKYSQDPRVEKNNAEIDRKVAMEESKKEPSKRKISSLEKKRIQYPDDVPTKKEYASATPEERAKYRELYPETFKEMTEAPISKKAKFAGNAFAFASKVTERGSVHAARNFGDTKSREEVQAEELGVTPLDIRMWKANFTPHTESDAYKKWKKLYRGK